MVITMSLQYVHYVAALAFVLSVQLLSIFIIIFVMLLCRHGHC